MSYLHTKFHDNWISSFRGAAMTSLGTNGRTDKRTDKPSLPSFMGGRGYNNSTGFFQTRKGKMYLLGFIRVQYIRYSVHPKLDFWIPSVSDQIIPVTLGTSHLLTGYHLQVLFQFYTFYQSCQFFLQLFYSGRISCPKYVFQHSINYISYVDI